MNASFVCHAKFEDWEAFAAAVPGALARLTPLRAGSFSTTATALSLGDVVLQVGRSTPMMSQISILPDAAWVVLPLGEPGALRLEGWSIGPGDIGVFGPRSEHAGAVAGETSWALVILPASTLQRLLQPMRRSPLRRPGAGAVLRVSGDAWERAASLIRCAATVAAEEPEVFTIAEARRGLRDELLDAMRELLLGPQGGPPGKVLPTGSRRRLLRALEHLLRVEPGRAAKVEGVSAALGVSTAHLQAAIDAGFAVDAERYLRLRRLALARAALHEEAADYRWAAVTQVAVRHGFPDAEAFAQEHHILLGRALPLQSQSAGA